MPIEIRPTEIVAMIQYTMEQHPDLFLYLKEIKSPSLQQMFVDAKEVENNLRVCGKLHDQIIDKDFNVQEMEEVYEQQGSPRGFIPIKMLICHLQICP